MNNEIEINNSNITNLTNEIDGCNQNDGKSSENSLHINSSNVLIDVVCEVGRVSVNLDKLTKLRIGDIIDFCSWPQVVRLIANGMCFAEGYLVETNGLLGVKITNSFVFQGGKNAE